MLYVVVRGTLTLMQVFIQRMQCCDCCVWLWGKGRGHSDNSHILIYLSAFVLTFTYGQRKDQGWKQLKLVSLFMTEWQFSDPAGPWSWKADSLCIEQSWVIQARRGCSLQVSFWMDLDWIEFSGCRWRKGDLGADVSVEGPHVKIGLGKQPQNTCKETCWRKSFSNLMLFGGPQVMFLTMSGLCVQYVCVCLIVSVTYAVVLFSSSTAISRMSCTSICVPERWKALWSELFWGFLIW